MCCESLHCALLWIHGVTDVKNEIPSGEKNPPPLVRRWQWHLSYDVKDKKHQTYEDLEQKE